MARIFFNLQDRLDQCGRNLFRRCLFNQRREIFRCSDDIVGRKDIESQCSYILTAAVASAAVEFFKHFVQTVGNQSLIEIDQDQFPDWPDIDGIPQGSKPGAV